MSFEVESIWGELSLSKNSNGLPHPNVDNASRILRSHPFYKGRIWFDSFHDRIRTNSDLDDVERSWADSDDIEVLAWMQSAMQIPKMGLAQIQQAVLLVAHSDIRREPETWLKSLRAWDGQYRLNKLMSLGFGAEDSPYTQAVSLNFVKSIAARILWPGCKADNMPVLEGPQGKGKTRGVAKLGGKWYSELHSQFGEKDAVQELRGKILIELAELEGLNKRQNEIVKAFLSRCSDTFRPSYGRHVIDVPRGCVFAGTTNEDSYLRDSTGARRYWPIRCGAIDQDWLEVNRDQLFAEAYERVSQLQETWWEMPSDETEREQDARYADDPWTEPITRYLVGADTCSAAELLTDAVHLEISRQTKREQMRVGQILRRLGWHRDKSGAARQRVWRRSSAAGGPGSPVVALIKPHSKPVVEPHEPRELPQ